MPFRRFRLALALVACALGFTERAPAEPLPWTAPGSEPSTWTWTLRFPGKRPVGGAVQTLGSHPFVLRDAPCDYVWEGSEDGIRWKGLPGGAIRSEQRCRRVLRFDRTHLLSGLRIRILRSTEGTPPVVQHVEILASPREEAALPPWIVVVNSTHDPSLPGHGQEFIPLAGAAMEGQPLEAQQVWVPTLTPEFLDTEPRPLAVFLSGSFKDWCEVDRTHWRGVERVLRRGRDPLWASCGGAQALAILADRGTRRPWDCPHCRDPRNPRLAIYGHIGHVTSGLHRCGDYADCVFERGAHTIRPTVRDAVFEGLPDEFQVMESHCGQIEYPPRGWRLVATGGAGTRTVHQCLRRGQLPVYAAQFHIEMAGTPEVSRRIMSNFLRLASDFRAKQ